MDTQPPSLPTHRAALGCIAPSVVVHHPSALVASALAMVIDRHGVCRVAATAASMAETLELLHDEHPAVLVLSLPGSTARGAAGAITAVKRFAPQTALVLISEHRDRPFLAAMLRAGTDACLHCSETSQRLHEALDAACNARTYLSPSIMRDLNRRRQPRRRNASCTLTTAPAPVTRSYTRSAH